MRFSRVSWCVALLLNVAAAVAQTKDAPTNTPGTTIIKAADLQADFAVLRSAYEALHPGLYRYSSKGLLFIPLLALLLNF